MIFIILFKGLQKLVKCKLSNRIKELKVEQILYKRAYSSDQ